MQIESAVLYRVCLIKKKQEPTLHRVFLAMTEMYNDKIQIKLQSRGTFGLVTRILV